MTNGFAGVLTTATSPYLVQDATVQYAPDTLQVTVAVLPVHNWTQHTYSPTIQAAINAAANGDDIEVSPGTYSEHLTMPHVGGGAAVNFTLRSSDPNDWNVVSRTVIDAAGFNSPGIRFHGDNSSDMVVSGLTIRHGYSNSTGGGLAMSGCAATIRQCIITDNVAAACGGGIDSNWGTIDNCIIKNNSAAYVGGGLYSPNGTVKNCRILGNKVTDSEGEGAGCFTSGGTLINCVIAHNHSYYDGGGLSGMPTTLTGCTIINNMADDMGGGVLLYGNRTVKDCILYGNTTSELGRQVYTPVGTLRLSYCGLPLIQYGEIEGYPIQEDCIYGDPGLLALGNGSWTGVTYISADDETTLTDVNASWTGGELAGKWIDVNTDEHRFFLVVGNDATTITVWGNASAYATGASYQVLEYHLASSGSPCFNTGDPNYVAQEDETDIDGKVRIQNNRVDIGADEIGEEMPQMGAGTQMQAAAGGAADAAEPTEAAGASSPDASDGVTFEELLESLGRLKGWRAYKAAHPGQ